MVTWTDFVSFAFIRHFFNHNWILLKCICSFCVAVSRSCVVRKAVSSANVAVVLSAVVSQLCSVGREVGPGRCPVAGQI